MIQKNVVIVAHKFLPQMDDELVPYLNAKKYPHVLHIYHSFSDASDRRSFFKLFKNGKMIKEKQSSDYAFLPEPFVYIKELLFTLIWIFQTKLSWDDFIGMDGLCTNFGLLLKKIGRVKKVIYWAVDFVPEKRFSAEWKNAVYQRINISGYTNADEMWDLSPRMKEARKKYLGITEKDYKKSKVVPYGMWTERIVPVPYEKCEHQTIVFMGHLLPKQGVQLVIRALPEIKKKIKDIRLKIIGAGLYEEELRKLVKDLKVEKECMFLGKIDDNKEMEKEIAKSAVAVAPYIKSLDTWTYFADPGKVKTYLACGVPVLLTDIPWNTSEIVKEKCGLVISEDELDIAKKVIMVLDKKVNSVYRKNAKEYAKRFDYTEIFAQLY